MLKENQPLLKFTNLWQKNDGHLATSELQTALNFYANGLQFYYKRKWGDAKKSLLKVLELLPNDGPSITYIKRIEAFELNPPQQEWNGVFELKTK